MRTKKSSNPISEEVIKRKVQDLIDEVFISGCTVVKVLARALLNIKGLNLSPLKLYGDDHSVEMVVDIIREIFYVEYDHVLDAIMVMDNVDEITAKAMAEKKRQYCGNPDIAPGDQYFIYRQAVTEFCRCLVADYETFQFDKLHVMECDASRKENGTSLSDIICMKSPD